MTDHNISIMGIVRSRKRKKKRKGRKCEENGSYFVDRREIKRKGNRKKRRIIV